MPTGWAGTAPADMTDDQLKQAVRSVSHVFADLQANMNQVQQISWHLQNEVSARFGMPVPGLPPVDQLAAYPEDFASGYDWPTQAALKKAAADDTASN